VLARFPGATWRGDGVSGGNYTGGPFKVVLHTTETRTIPGYQNGQMAPHLTYFPAGRYFVQHTSFLTASRALRNTSIPGQTNRDSALQLEIVCYSAKGIADQVGGRWVGHLSELHLQDIAQWLIWCRDVFGVQMKWRNKTAFKYADANAPGYRMSSSVWDSWNGVARHQDVPENDHWDTGALDMAKLLALTQPMPTPPVYTPPPPGYVRLPSGTLKRIEDALATARLDMVRILNNPQWYTTEQVYYATMMNELEKE
jgi:hypothetical protein